MFASYNSAPVRKLLASCYWCIASFAANPVQGFQFGPFLYDDFDGPTVTITDCSPAIIHAAIPSSIDGKPVTRIGTRAFASCVNMVSVSIPSSVTRIERWAFESCSSLQSVVIPAGVKVIEESAFMYCSSLTSVTIPNGVTSIDIWAFEHCTSLASISIPASVTTIGFAAFGTTGLTSVVIPATVTSLGTGVFHHCASLSSATISSPITHLPENLFGNCTSLLTVTLPDSITSMGDGVFRDCESLTGFPFPPNLASIGHEAFFSCDSLEHVILSDLVTFIGEEAFSECSSLRAISVGAENPNYRSLGGVLFNKAGTLLIQFPAGKAGRYRIPDDVETLGESSFAGSGKLSQITISDDVEQILFGAFFNCDGLETVTIPTNMDAIDDSAFYDCGMLERVNFMGNAPAVGQYAFSGTSEDFAVYYFTGADGFTSPTWMNYPAVDMGIPTPATTWLVTNDIDHDEEITAVPDEDGVNLLLAYALDLDPHVNTQSGLPQPVIAAGQMTLRFYGARPGIDYKAETSTLLDGWSSQGVTLSDPDPNGIRTASVSVAGPGQYLRVVVSN